MKSPPHTGSLHALQQQAAQLQQETSSGKGRLQGGTKLLLEEKEQELLAKEETVQVGTVGVASVTIYAGSKAMVLCILESEGLAGYSVV